MQHDWCAGGLALFVSDVATPLRFQNLAGEQAGKARGRMKFDPILVVPKPWGSIEVRGGE